MIRGFFAFLLALSLTHRAAAARAAEDSPIEIDHADSLETAKADDNIVLKGDVRVRQEDLAIQADELAYDRRARTLTASGHVRIQDGGDVIETESVVYDVSKESARFVDAVVLSPPWVIRAPEVEKRGREEIRFKGGWFSTCDEDPPHFHVRASSVRIRKDRSVLAWNLVLFVGPVPMFYFPFFYRSLKDKRAPILLDVGETLYLGRYVKTQFNYFLGGGQGDPLSSSIPPPQHMGSLYLDNFKNKGWGGGFQHAFRLGSWSRADRGGGMNGSAYFYTVGVIPRERRVAEDATFTQARWSSSLSLDGGLPLPGGALQFTTRSNLVSDEEFNHQFAVANRNPGAGGDRLVTGTLSKRLGPLSVSARAERQDVYLRGTEGRFVKDRVLLPDLSLNLVTLRLPVRSRLFSLYGNGSGSWRSEARAAVPAAPVKPPFRSGQANLSVTASLNPIRRILTLGQTGGLASSWAQKAESVSLVAGQPPSRVLSGHTVSRNLTYSADSSLKTPGGWASLGFRRNLSWALDRPESSARKLQRDQSTASLDINVPFHRLQFSLTSGLGYNHILNPPPLAASSSVTAFAAPLTTITTTTHPVLGSIRERKFDMLRESLALRVPARSLNIAGALDYSLAARRLRRADLSLGLEGRRLWLVRLDGMFENNNVSQDGLTVQSREVYDASGLISRDPDLHPNHFVMGLDVTVPLFRVYRVSAQERFDFSSGEFSTRRYKFYRDLHCWEAEVVWEVAEKNLAGKRDNRIGFTINLKALPQRNFKYEKSRFDQFRSLEQDDYLEELEKEVQE